MCKLDKNEYALEDGERVLGYKDEYSIIKETYTPDAPGTPVYLEPRLKAPFLPPRGEQSIHDEIDFFSPIASEYRSVPSSESGTGGGQKDEPDEILYPKATTETTKGEKPRKKPFYDLASGSELVKGAIGYTTISSSGSTLTNAESVNGLETLQIPDASSKEQKNSSGHKTKFKGEPLKLATTSTLYDLKDIMKKPDLQKPQNTWPLQDQYLFHKSFLKQKLQSTWPVATREAKFSVFDASLLGRLRVTDAEERSRDRKSKLETLQGNSGQSVLSDDDVISSNRSQAESRDARSSDSGTDYSNWYNGSASRTRPLGIAQSVHYNRASDTTSLDTKSLSSHMFRASLQPGSVYQEDDEDIQTDTTGFLNQLALKAEQAGASHSGSERTDTSSRDSSKHEAYLHVLA
eukprot:m.7261 g.7261  ORF g.7261 m.7261 type:complete len:405 (+) comp3676_c0_seq1:103-1317(+)